MKNVTNWNVQGPRLKSSDPVEYDLKRICFYHFFQKILSRGCKKALSSICDSCKMKNDKSLINEADEYGLSLIHYFAAINYHEAIVLLVNNGISVNTRT